MTSTRSRTSAKMRVVAVGRLRAVKSAVIAAETAPGPSRRGLASEADVASTDGSSGETATATDTRTVAYKLIEADGTWVATVESLEVDDADNGVSTWTFSARMTANAYTFYGVMLRYQDPEEGPSPFTMTWQTWDENAQIIDYRYSPLCLPVSYNLVENDGVEVLEEVVVQCMPTPSVTVSLDRDAGDTVSAEVGGLR